MVVPIPAPLAAVPRTEFLGSTLVAWITAAVTAVVIAAALLGLRRVLVARIGAIAARTATQIDDMVVALVAATRAWVVIAIALYFASRSLVIRPEVGTWLDHAAKLVALWQTAVWCASAIGFWTKQHLARRTTAGDRASIAMINALGVGAKVLVWFAIALTALEAVFNIHVTALITGLGVGGIAVALAVQNILGDILAALAIVFDKPFDVGDAIGVDTITGTVEHIGLKTTRLRSLSGEQIIIGNGDLLKSRLRNYRRMYQRRVVLTLGVTYDTPPDTLARLPGVVKEIVAAQSPVKFDRAHVSALADSAIQLEVVYYVLDPDYTRHMDIQQAVLLGLLRQFAALDVDFAFPTQTLHHEGLPELPALAAAAGLAPAATPASAPSPHPPRSTGP